jgi:hypothetical protein
MPYHRILSKRLVVEQVCAPARIRWRKTLTPPPPPLRQVLTALRHGVPILCTSLVASQLPSILSTHTVNITHGAHRARDGGSVVTLEVETFESNVLLIADTAEEFAAKVTPTPFPPFVWVW